MKMRLHASVTMGIVAVLAVFGMVKRTTYTNLTQEENYLDQLVVAEIPDQYAISSCEELEKVLPECEIILRVKVLGELEHEFYNDKQLVLIQEVYAGEELEAGQEIYLCSDHWLLSADSNGSIATLERGFVNILKEGDEYLVFAEKQMEDLYSTTPVYKLYDETNIVPVFCYENRTNTILPISEENSYVSYKDVRDNEFFAVTENGMRTWENLKVEMLSKYPR